MAKYVPPLDSNGMDHYVACCLTNYNWVERNDLLKYKENLSLHPSKIKISGILYVKSVH